MSSWLVIALASLLIALIATIGGIWALMKQQVVVDADGNYSEIDIPFLGKLKSNYPSLIAIFLGIGLAAFVISKITVTVDSVLLTANVTVDEGTNGSHLIVGAIPTGYLKVGTIDLGSQSTFQMQVDRGGAYNVVAFTLVAIDDGKPIFALAQGPAAWDNQSAGLFFEGKLGGAIDR